jgi:hypothetical protein
MTQKAQRAKKRWGRRFLVGAFHPRMVVKPRA